MKLFDGRYHAVLLEELMRTYMAGHGVPKGKLLIAQVGDNQVSEKYISLKKSLCERLGINVYLLKISAELADIEIKSQIKRAFEDPQVRGGIVQLPLPRMSLKSVLEDIPLDKDIDLLSSKSLEHIYAGSLIRMPPVVRSLDFFLKTAGIKIHSMSTTVIGGGRLVGIPISKYLTLHRAKVDIMDSYQSGTNLNSELVICSAGVPNLVKGQDLKHGCNLVDFGSTVQEKKTVGDFDLSSRTDHLGIISPSPGGMGPLVVRFLVMNFIGI